MTPPDPVCLRCGYDLRLATADSACPECGLAVHRSLGARVHPDDSPPGWVRRIATGSLLLLVSYLLAPVSIGVAHFCEGLRASVNLAGVVFAAELAIVTLVHFVANVLLAEKDPGRPETRAERWQRRALWASIVPVMWAAFACWIIFEMTTRLTRLSGLTIDLLKYTPLTFIVLPALSFERLRRLALRLSRPRLAEHIRIVAVGSAASCGAAFLSLFTLFRASSPWTMLPIATALACVALFILWGLALLFFITPRFFRSARAAREKWRSADAALADRRIST